MEEGNLNYNYLNTMRYLLSYKILNENKIHVNVVSSCKVISTSHGLSFQLAIKKLSLSLEAKFI